MLFFTNFRKLWNFKGESNTPTNGNKAKTNKHILFDSMSEFYIFLNSKANTPSVDRSVPTFVNLADVNKTNVELGYKPFYLSLTIMVRKIRYLIYNWVYTTNHKRIGLNYFNFVLVSGTAGMALASIIRSELAYPGKGIMMGDAIQYLTFATAHGVIMVFFMIMPAIAGAFGNFLLPTQLGVHDVAFPRLNSASFWFLPGGLLMLFHLVCTDKRYAKLNYFNIQQYQGIIRHRHFTELINSNEHHMLLNPTSTSLRYKLNTHNVTEQNITLFYKYGVTNTAKTKNLQFNANSISNFNYLNKSNTQNFLMSFYNNLFETYDILFGDLLFGLNIISTLNNLLISAYSNLKLNYLSNTNIFNLNFFNNSLIIFDYIKGIFSFLTIFLQSFLNPSSMTSNFTYSTFIDYFKPLFTFLNLNIFNFNLYYCLLDFNILFTALKDVIELSLFFSFENLFPYAIFNTNKSSSIKSNLTYSSENIINKNEFNQINSGFFELSNYYRFLNTSNPFVKIYYKPCDLKAPWSGRHPIMLRWINRELPLADNSRAPYWYFSPQYIDDLEFFFKNFKLKFFLNNNYATLDPRKKIESFEGKTVSAYEKNLSYEKNFFLPFDSFFNFSYILENTFYNLQNRWISIHSIDNKFYRMYHTNTTQHRIMAKWRELKFTREAWRCKRLVARNQSPSSIKKVDPYYTGKTFVRQRTNRDLIPGWTLITPFISRIKFTLTGKVDIGVLGVWLALNASMISSANFLVTYRYISTLNNRKMRDARCFFTESLMVSSWMVLAANPMLAIALLMIICDRHWKTSFFDYSGGGDSVLFQHMFWFFGHPEVYIVMIPVFGFANTIFSYYFRKRISARASLLYSMYTIAFLGFWVWGHHMYMVGLSHTTRMLFSTLTVMISVPASTKIMHWCVTIVSSAFIIEVPVLFSMLFAFFFSTGGISGMGLAHVGTDVLFHDTFYVIGHFHIMFASAAMYGIFAGYYFYFPALFGVKYSRIYAYMHLTYYFLGQVLTVAPMIWLGYWGMPRRILDYPYSLGGWHSLASVGHMVAMAGIFCFYIMIYDSIRQSRAPIRNTFGIARFNTRLNFFMFEYNKLTYVNFKSWFLYREPNSYLRSKKRVDYLRLVLINTTLFSYSFHK